jgi:hypothetical protein
MYAVGWFSLAFINAALANVDHRARLKYFVLSLLIGPLATILIAGTTEDDDGKLHFIDLLEGVRRRRARLGARSDCFLALLMIGPE